MMPRAMGVREGQKVFKVMIGGGGVGLGGVVVGFLQVLHIIGQRPCTNAFLTMVSKHLLLGPSDILK